MFYSSHKALQVWLQYYYQDYNIFSIEIQRKLSITVSCRRQQLCWWIRNTARRRGGVRCQRQSFSSWTSSPYWSETCMPSTLSTYDLLTTTGTVLWLDSSSTSLRIPEHFLLKQQIWPTSHSVWWITVMWYKPRWPVCLSCTVLLTWSCIFTVLWRKDDWINTSSLQRGVLCYA